MGRRRRRRRRVKRRRGKREEEEEEKGEELSDSMTQTHTRILLLTLAVRRQSALTL